MTDPRQATRRGFPGGGTQWEQLEYNSCDGIPGYALGMSGLMSGVAPFVTRTFNVGSRQAQSDSELVLRSPAVGILSTPGDDSDDWLATGQALASVLLRATADDISAAFLNAPIEVAALRQKLRAATRLPGHPQILLRMGHGPPGRLTPRRSVRDVLLQ